MKIVVFNAGLSTNQPLVLFSPKKISINNQPSAKRKANLLQDQIAHNNPSDKHTQKK
jgi:hypothetical protein